MRYPSPFLIGIIIGLILFAWGGVIVVTAHPQTHHGVIVAKYTDNASTFRLIVNESGTLTGVSVNDTVYYGDSPIGSAYTWQTPDVLPSQLFIGFFVAFASVILALGSNMPPFETPFFIWGKKNRKEA